jgi:hypothetical protein
LFDRWTVGEELINFALDKLPFMYAIPGQHDLPLHNMDLIHKSAFWTMVMAKRIQLIKPGGHAIDGKIILHGFPWGSPIQPIDNDKEGFHIAVCHQYFWTGVHHYPGASKNKQAKAMKEFIQGYDAVLFGDNHKGFLTQVNGIPVMNCGTFMRRASDEVDYRPQVGFIHSDGSIDPYYLPIEGEEFMTLDEEASYIREVLKSSDLDDLMTDIQSLKSSNFDFVQALEEAMDKADTSAAVRAIVIEAIEKGKL